MRSAAFGLLPSRVGLKPFVYWGTLPVVVDIFCDVRRNRRMHSPRSRPPLLSAVIMSLHTLALFTLAGCATNGSRIDRVAKSAGLQRLVVAGTLHSHVVYEKTASASHDGQLFVFLEGDGSPWGSSGMQPAADPTTRNPLALRLMLATDAKAIYVARPCYHGYLDAQCSAERWTGGRYSEEVVASMVAAIAREAAKLRAGNRIDQLIVVGYSGGGVLAVLIAERLANVAAVITIGANLDIVAWAAHHRYLPLSQSLNPRSSPLPHPWKEFHFIGANDAVVPAATADEYFRRYPEAQRITLANADHVCCWQTNWPALLAGLRLPSQSE